MHLQYLIVMKALSNKFLNIAQFLVHCKENSRQSCIKIEFTQVRLQVTKFNQTAQTINTHCLLLSLLKLQRTSQLHTNGKLSRRAKILHFASQRCIKSTHVQNSDGPKRFTIYRLLRVGSSFLKSFSSMSFHSTENIRPCRPFARILVFSPRPNRPGKYTATVHNYSEQITRVELGLPMLGTASKTSKARIHINYLPGRPPSRLW